MSYGKCQRPCRRFAFHALLPCLLRLLPSAMSGRNPPMVSGANSGPLNIKTDSDNEDEGLGSPEPCSIQDLQSVLRSQVEMSLA